MTPKKQNVIVICGPTASGKTGLALQLAKELPKANILSVDSRQVYKDLGLITGKDIPKNLPSTIKIFGLDIFNSDERANLGDFVRYSQKVINDSVESNTPLIIVGGTGLYLKALTQELTDVTIPPNPKLRDAIEKLSLNELQELLQNENPEKYQSLNRSDFMNPRRLIRAIEISTSLRHSEEQSDEATPANKNYNYAFPIFHWVGFLPDKETIKTKIHQRVQERLNAGAIDEVEAFLAKYPDKSLPIYTSLGVSQIIDFLEKKITLEELKSLWTKSEIDYAGRQIVWFKKQPDIVWYDKSTDRDLLVSRLKNIYNQNA